MNPTWAEIAKYAFYAVAVWAVCKYVIASYRDEFSQQKADALKELAGAYEKVYSKTIEERAKITIELVRLGKSKEEISGILDEALPLPDAPQI